MDCGVRVVEGGFVRSDTMAVRSGIARCERFLVFRTKRDEQRTTMEDRHSRAQKVSAMF
jgi:hypothetical protein